jgi:hypothetical protein
MRFRLILLTIPILFLLAAPSFAEQIPVKAQGSAECGMLYVSQSERDAAILDAKRKALDKYISGVKSQNEANRFLAARPKLYENIDEYVKDVAEIASEKKNGRIYITIQAAIDRTTLNKFLGDSFKSDSKKAGLKRKKVAFIFVAREVDTAANVKTHTVDQASDSSRARSDEMRDTSTKGESSTKASNRGREDRNLDYSGNERQTSNRSGAEDISIARSERETSDSQEKSQEEERISMQGDSKIRQSGQMTGNVEYKGDGSVRISGNPGETADVQAQYRESGKYRVDADVDKSARLNAEANRVRNQQSASETARAGNLESKGSMKVDAKSEGSLELKETKSGRYDTATEESTSWAGKARDTNSSRSESDSTRNSERKSTEIRHSEKYAYRVSEYGTVNAQLTELFKEQGMRVSESLDAAEILGKMAKTDSVNQIRPGDIKKTISTAKEENIDFLLIGTLDVGIERNDPATGNIQREVLLNANVYDLHGKGIEKAAAVGNLHFTGLGGSPDIAKNNALSKAVKEASVKLIAQTREYILEAAEEE